MKRSESSALIIEDNLELAENVRELLDEVCDRVLVAHDADRGLALAAEGVDLAIVDVRLPGALSGLDLVPLIRRASPRAEVILMTGNATVDTAAAAVRHGVFAYVLKPFDSQNVVTLAERALAQVALRRERALLAAELEASEALHRGVVDSVEALIVGVDVDGAITLFNRFAQSTTGRSVSAAHGHSFAGLCFDDVNRAALERALAAAYGGETVRDLQLTLLTSTGAARIVRWTLTALLPSGASLTAVLCVGLDVTETLELHRRTVESEAMAAMGVLTTGLAHEIRNPLNAATLQLEALVRAGRKLADDAQRAQLERRVRIVKGELARLSSMLNDFLRLATPRGLNTRRVDMKRLIEEVVALKAPIAEEAGVELSADAEGLRLPAKADLDKIKQVLLNLIGNALDAMHEVDQGAVRVEARHTRGGMIEVRVIDDGPGLSGEVAGQIFQPFVTTKPAGTGLGLTIVQRIVGLHGGEVSLEARKDAHGAIARFTLPEAPPEPS